MLGPEPNTVGNFVIAGHNYRNNKFFSNLSKLQTGDLVNLSDRNNIKLTYKVYDKYQVDESDFTCTNQNTNGKKEITLITCVNYNKKKRLIIKCRSE